MHHHHKGFGKTFEHKKATYLSLIEHYFNNYYECSSVLQCVRCPLQDNWFSLRSDQNEHYRILSSMCLQYWYQCASYFVTSGRVYFILSGKLSYPWIATTEVAKVIVIELRLDFNTSQPWHHDYIFTLNKGAVLLHIFFWTPCIVLVMSNPLLFKFGCQNHCQFNWQ